MKKFTLNGTWQMKDLLTNTAYDAIVPGSVLSCLIDHKAIKDPYYRDNEYEIRDLFWRDYEYSRAFTVEDGMMEESNLDLVCYGLDTLGEIYLNGELLASTNNMHRTWRFPIKDRLQVGENELRILFRSTLKYIEEYEYAPDKEIHIIPSGGMKGNQLIRKAHSMFGWDWGAQLPDAGIFRDIEIEAYSLGRLEEVRFQQIHKEKEVSLEIDCSVDSLRKKSCCTGLQKELCERKTHPVSSVMNSTLQASEITEPYYDIRVTVIDPLGKETVVSSEESRCVSQSDEGICRISKVINIPEPKLWWPNGFGEQPLYDVKVTLLCSGAILEEKEYTIGLRTLTVSQEKDEWGSEFALKVNGVKIFTKGANYIPEDCVYSWITKDRIEYLVKSSVRANYNCLRVWGGGYYPSDTFYELCDRYGLIVWQDLMYACNVYDLTEEFEESIVEETKDNVRRLRHHACLGLWCGNNELESAWVNWGNFKMESKKLRADYIKQFEYILPKALKKEDDTTFFWPSSPSSGGCFDDPDDENRGDTHYWSVWHGLLPFSDYQNHYFRFCSEFGFQSFPSMKTVKTYTEACDRNIFSKVMESHQKNDAANGKMLYYLSENFRYPKDFESLLYVTQILQGLAIKSGVEHFRRNRGRCMGSLYWQINDNWPVASWSSIDYYGRWKVLHYMAKNFYAPVAGSLVRHDSKMEVFLQNESLNGITAKATLSLKTMDLQVLDYEEFQVEVAPLTAVLVGGKDYSTILEKIDQTTVFVELMITYADGTVQVETETFVPYKHLQLLQPDIRVDVEEMEDVFRISLSTNAFANFVELDFEEADAIFEDNYFALTDTKGKDIVLRKEDIRGTSFSSAADLHTKLSIRTVRDSYDFV
ncbi:MAG TPA: glycoside hydrolase family 2 protein [Lachnospiraceae bacterium]|nr:glycoside hydrolase family 2 protein [Lachnospiraceae bacterium]